MKRTPSNATAKTVLARKKVVVIAALVSVIALIIGTFWVAKKHSVYMRSGAYAYRLKVADSAQSRALGLGGRASMGTYEGMLFSYDDSVKSCFWMKDMLFPLDIIWLNTDHVVVYEQQNVSQKTYPHAFCTPTPARYVIELNANQARQAHIGVGAKLSFQKPKNAHAIMLLYASRYSFTGYTFYADSTFNLFAH